MCGVLGAFISFSFLEFFFRHEIRKVSYPMKIGFSNNIKDS